jgi:hypothetical protein
MTQRIKYRGRIQQSLATAQTVGICTVICGLAFFMASFWAARAAAGDMVASASNLSPQWTSQEALWMSPNTSLLNNIHYSNSENPFDPYIEKRAAVEIRQQYDDINRDYEFRRSYGLVDSYSEQAHTDQMSSLGQSAMQRFESYNGQQTEQGAKAMMNRNPDLHPLMGPIGVVGGAAALYRGSGVNMRVTDDTKVRAKASVRDRTGGLELNSPVIHGSIDMKVSTPSTVDPSAPPPLDPLSRDERYRVSLSRALPFDIASGISYGTTTSTMSASLSKRLTTNLTAVVGAARTMDQNLEALSPSEQSLKFLYGIHF